MPLTDRERWLMLQAWEGAMDHTDERAFEIWMEAIQGRSEEGAAVVSAPRATILDRQASDRFGEPIRTLPLFAHTNGQPEVQGTFRDMVERERVRLRQGRGDEVTHELLREIRDLLRPVHQAAGFVLSPEFAETVSAEITSMYDYLSNIEDAVKMAARGEL